MSASWRPYQAGHWVWSDRGLDLADRRALRLGDLPLRPLVPGRDAVGPRYRQRLGSGLGLLAGRPELRRLGSATPGANVNASYNAPPSNDGYQGGYDDQGGYDNGGYDDNANYDSEPVYQSSPGYGYDSGYTYGGGYGYGGYGSYAFGIAPEAYLFVPTRSFLSIDLFDFFVPWVRVSSFWGYTRNCTDYGFYGGRYFNRRHFLEHVHRFYRDVPRYRLSELGDFRGHGYQLDGNRLAFFRPQVNRGTGTPLDRSAPGGW